MTEPPTIQSPLYTGKLLDEATGLYYEGARYYDPETGRFITEDSVVGTGDDPQSLNRCAYEHLRKRRLN